MGTYHHLARFLTLKFILQQSFFATTATAL